jgi:hypothetical protein
MLAARNDSVAASNGARVEERGDSHKNDSIFLAGELFSTGCRRQPVSTKGIDFPKLQVLPRDEKDLQLLSRYVESDILRQRSTCDFFELSLHCRAYRL